MVWLIMNKSQKRPRNIHIHENTYEICGEQSGCGTGFSVITSVYSVTNFPPLIRAHIYPSIIDVA